MRGTMNLPGIASPEPGRTHGHRLSTGAVWLPDPEPPLSGASAVSDVEQALLHHLSEWITGGQHTLAPSGRVAEQGYRVTNPACGVVKVSQVGQARERICMVRAEQSLRIRADLLR